VKALDFDPTSWRSTAAGGVTNAIALTLSLGAMAFGLFWLTWILWETLRLGLGGLGLDVFTQMTPPPQAPGGLANAIYGSVLMVGLATTVGTPIGLFAGIYLPSTGSATCWAE
jgi:phosphate transport system permease protein